MISTKSNVKGFDHIKKLVEGGRKHGPEFFQSDEYKELQLESYKRNPKSAYIMTLFKNKEYDEIHKVVKEKRTPDKEKIDIEILKEDPIKDFADFKEYCNTQGIEFRIMTGCYMTGRSWESQAYIEENGLEKIKKVFGFDKNSEK